MFSLLFVSPEKWQVVMKNGRKFLIVLFSCLTVLIVTYMILVTILDQPIPLLPDSDDLKIASIVVYEDQLSDAKLLEEYDEAKILEFLKSCSEKIVLGSSVHKQVFRGLYPEVEIYIHGINGFDYGKDIILGDVSYSVGPSTSYIIERSYMIEDPEYVLATIKDILGL